MYVCDCVYVCMCVRVFVCVCLCVCVCVQVLYLPSMWFHQVAQADNTIAVNYW